MALTCPPISNMSQVTLILERARAGDPAAVGELLPFVYDELRRLAAHRMAGKAGGHTLQPTALVHEAWLRLGGDEQPGWQNLRIFWEPPPRRCAASWSSARDAGWRRSEGAAGNRWMWPKSKFPLR